MSIPNPGPGALTGGSLGQLLFRANRAFGEALIGRLQEAGFPDVRIAHSTAFAYLDPEAGGKAIEMAEMAGITRQSMGELLADLERLGYVTRAPDPGDRRAKRVLLTARGRECYAEAMRIFEAIADDYAAKLGPARLALLVKLLGDLTTEGTPSTTA